jgi:hypothetical protein
MDGQAGGPAPAGRAGPGGEAEPGGGAIRSHTVQERFIALVCGDDDLSDDQRGHILVMGLRALRGDAGLGVV